jgi:hypothetical protein
MVPSSVQKMNDATLLSGAGRINAVGNVAERLFCTCPVGLPSVKVDVDAIGILTTVGVIVPEPL